MRYPTYYVAAVLLCIATISFSFVPDSAVKRNSFIDRYSIDPLPDSWKQNKSLVQAIDIIMTTSVKELETSLACTDCKNSPYSVSLLVDSPLIVKQTYSDIGNKKNTGGYNYECKTVFRFKSSLAVYDINQKGIAKVMVTDPEQDEYVVTKKFNLYHKTGVGKLTPEEYISQNAAEVGPGMAEMLKYAEKKIYRLRDDIHKLKSRH